MSFHNTSVYQIITMYTLNKHNLYLSVIPQDSLGQNTAYGTSPIRQQRAAESTVKAVSGGEQRSRCQGN